MNFKQHITTLAFFALTTLVLSSCGAQGQVKATRAIKMGERFYNNWDGTKVGDVDSLVLMSAYAGHDLSAGQEIRPQDIIQAVNIDVEWLKNTSFCAAKNPTMKLTTVRGSKIRIEKDGKLTSEGVWSFDSGVDTNCLTVQIPQQPTMQLFGARASAGKRRFLICPSNSGTPQQIWVEELAQSNNSISARSLTKHSRKSAKV